MKINIRHFDITDARYQDCLAIRYKVLRAPLGMQILPEDLAKDATSTHILATMGGKPAGTVALNATALRQMAVLDEFQGQGIGAKLVRYLEKIANLPEIILDARQNAIPFYEKLGYECCSELYEKIGILHRDMRKKIIL